MKIEIGPYPDDDSERKIDVQLDKFDTWNMDDTLAHIILPMLKQLKETKHGSHIVDDEDVPEELRTTSNTYQDHAGNQTVFDFEDDDNGETEDDDDGGMEDDDGENDDDRRSSSFWNL